VITTGSLSGKGVNFGSSRAVHYIHGEAGINFGDFMPADRDLVKGLMMISPSSEKITLGWIKIR